MLPRASLLLGVAWALSASAQDILVDTQSLVPLKAVSVQNRPRPEYDPIGIALGSFQVSPQLTVGESYDDNVYATDTNTVSDRLTTITGSTTIATQGTSPSLSATGGFTSQTYARNHLENYLNWNAGASFSDELVEYRTAVSASADLSRNHVAREDPSFPATATAPPGFDTRGGLVDLKRYFAIGNLDFSASFHNLDFNAAQLPQGVMFSQDFKDRNELILDFRGNFLVGPTTSAFVRAVHKSLDYTQDSQVDGLNRDSTTDTIAGGSSFQVTDLMRGEVGVGVLHLHNHDPAQGRQTTLAFRANLEMYLTQLLTGTLTVERTTGPADITGSSSYISTNETARLDYELRRNIILSANYSRMRRLYTGLDDDETTSEGGVSGLWLINRTLKFNLGYTLSRRTSPLQAFLGQNYTERVIEASLEVAL
jgi:hypothetical protein